MKFLNEHGTHKKCVTFFSVLTVFAMIAAQNSAKAVLWEEQAIRLQNVNAALLDSAPLPTPGGRNFSLSGYSHISILPKVNSQVGGKTEKAPSAPVHGVPSLAASYGLGILKESTFNFGANAGYLPSFFGSLIGLKAKLSQFQFGANTSFQTLLLQRKLEIEAGLSFHSTSAEVTGKIASKNADDKFNASTTYLSNYYLLKWKPWKTWLGTQFSLKNTKSTFEIADDKTKIELEDKLKPDTNIPIVTSVWIGINPIAGFWTQLGYTLVPERVYLPRISLGYSHTFGKKQKDVASAEQASPEIQKEATSTKEPAVRSTPSTQVSSPSASPEVTTSPSKAPATKPSVSKPRESKQGSQTKSGSQNKKPTQQNKGVKP